MAELNMPASATGRWTAAQAKEQFRAIAWLRWRIFVNGFKRKGGGGEAAATFITYPLAACFALFPVGGAGALAGYFASQGQFSKLSLVLWGMFVLSQLLNIQLGQPGTTFDPTQLIRFPVSLKNYVAIRLFFGVLAPSNILSVLMSLSVAIGVTIAVPSLWFYAFAAMAVYALVNVLFTRMVFAWVDRWMAKRRSREIFTMLIFAVSLLFQWVNVQFNGGGRHQRAQNREKIAAVERIYDRVHPFVKLLPPESTASAIGAGSSASVAAYGANLLGCAAFGLVFLGVFAVRTRTEYRGEVFSDVANAVNVKKHAPRAAGAATLPALAAHPRSERSSQLAGMMGKELLTIRRNLGLLYALVVPVFLIFLWTAKLGSNAGHVYWVFPGALAYTLLVVASLSYNSFGMEGAGIQFYFLAPVRMRDVVLAKNLLHFAMAAFESLVVFAIIVHFTGMPTLRIIVATFLWGVATLLMTVMVGNRRSIQAPKKIDLSRAAGKQASQLSSLISIGLLLAASAVGGGLMVLSHMYGFEWVLAPVMGVLAAVTVVIYRRDLENMDAFAAEHREEMFEELCKAG